MDRAILDWINGWPEWMAPGMRFLSEATTYLWFKVALALLVAGMIGSGGRARKAAIFALLAFLLANTMTDVLKDIAPLNRPCQDFPSMNGHGIGCSGNPGTASAHSANMAAAAAAFTWFLGRWGIAWIVIALATGLSRIYVAAHYPSEVLLGWLCGVVASFVLIGTWHAYTKKRESVEEPES